MDADHPRSGVLIPRRSTDGRLARCPLKGRIGDAIFAILCGCGHNIRKILAHLRAFWCLLLYLINAVTLCERRRHSVASAA